MANFAPPASAAISLAGLATGIGIELFKRFGPNYRGWKITNLENPRGEIIDSQFEAENLTENVGSVWGESWAINRDKSIQMFLRGTSDTITFSARFFARDITEVRGVKTVRDKLRQWAKKDEKLGRPPLLAFQSGDAHVQMKTCIITGVSLVYDAPAFKGAFRGATLSISLREFEPFELSAQGLFDTRYHRSKRGDYYELLAQREYGNPLLGVVIRQRNPKLIGLDTGDVVPLPSRNGSIQRERIQTSSVALEGINDRSDNPTKTRFEELLAKRSGSSLSFSA